MIVANVVGLVHCVINMEQSTLPLATNAIALIHGILSIYLSIYIPLSIYSVYTNMMIAQLQHFMDDNT